MKYFVQRDNNGNPIAVYTKKQVSTDESPLDESHADVQAILNPAPSTEELRKESLMSGIEFEGVMCSAHKEDQWGLDSVKNYIISGMDIDFEFKNGNVLTLTQSNIAAFEAVWFPFRVAHTRVNFQP